MNSKQINTNGKNQINIGKMGKENIIANGDTAIATGKSAKSTEKKSIWATLAQKFLDFLKGK